MGPENLLLVAALSYSACQPPRCDVSELMGTTISDYDSLVQLVQTDGPLHGSVKPVAYQGGDKGCNNFHFPDLMEGELRFNEVKVSCVPLEQYQAELHIEIGGVRLKSVQYGSQLHQIQTMISGEPPLEMRIKCALYNEQGIPEFCAISIYDSRSTQ